jgi:hypothetical protein
MKKCMYQFSFKSGVDEFLQYNYNNSGHYPSFCLLFLTRRFEDWILYLELCVLEKKQDER